MIYTIGHEVSYLKAIEEQGTIWKTGRGNARDIPNYEGGYCFQTIQDAQRRIDEAYSDHGFIVFGLLTEWANTYNKGDWWNLLLEDAEIVVL